MGASKDPRRNDECRFAQHKVDRSSEKRAFLFLGLGFVACVLAVSLNVPWWGRLYLGLIAFGLTYCQLSNMWSGRKVRQDVELNGFDGRVVPRDGYYGAAQVQGGLVDAENRFGRILSEAPRLPEEMSDETIRFSCIYLDQQETVIAVEAFGGFKDVYRNIRYLQKVQGYMWRSAAELYGTDPERCVCKRVRRNKERGIENDQCVFTFRRRVAQTEGVRPRNGKYSRSRRRH